MSNVKSSTTKLWSTHPTTSLIRSFPFLWRIPWFCQAQRSPSIVQPSLVTCCPINLIHSTGHRFQWTRLFQTKNSKRKSMSGSKNDCTVTTKRKIKFSYLFCFKLFFAGDKIKKTVRVKIFWIHWAAKPLPGPSISEDPSEFVHNFCCLLSWFCYHLQANMHPVWCKSFEILCFSRQSRESSPLNSSRQCHQEARLNVCKSSSLADKDEWQSRCHCDCILRIVAQSYCKWVCHRKTVSVALIHLKEMFQKNYEISKKTLSTLTCTNHKITDILKEAVYCTTYPGNDPNTWCQFW